jgi:cell wall-associated NlpC family hydrolase
LFSDLNDLIGKPFEYGARGPDKYDCYGLCMEVYRRIGKELLDYGSDEDFRIIQDKVNGNKKDFIRLEKPEPFCFVTFMILKPYVSHIGIVLEDCLSFIHVVRFKRFVCIEPLDSPRWRSRIDGFWHYGKD